MNPPQDVVIVGGGHNALVAATYLASAGMNVEVLERLGHTGGAAVSATAFDGFPTRLSRYSYLVSLMPQTLIDDLGLNLSLGSRSTASYSPYLRGDKPGGLFVEASEAEATRASFRELTGGDDAYEAWRAFYAEVGELARVIEPTLLEPLRPEREIQAQVDPQLWTDLVRRPLGEAITRRFDDDLVRGVVATDALIGTFARMDSESLIHNRCFLYHLIGNQTGEWRVPIGGMGAVTDELARVATEAGAVITTGAEVLEVLADDTSTEIRYRVDGKEKWVAAAFALSGIAPEALRPLLGGSSDEDTAAVGSQLKINFLLSRLPRLASGADPEIAFAGTLHLNEEYSNLDAAFDEAAGGAIPSRLPGEMYCHSLTDPSILGDVPARTQTLTYFGLHTPATLFIGDNASVRDEAVAAAIASINQHLAEPLEDCIARDSAGELCIEAKSPLDIEADLNMPGGHIFHGDLEWPWCPNRSRLDHPAAAWGVRTDRDALLMCGSGARRGGAVSGIGGHNAAQAVLALS